MTTNTQRSKKFDRFHVTIILPFVRSEKIPTFQGAIDTKAPPPLREAFPPTSYFPGFCDNPQAPIGSVCPPYDGTSPLIVSVDTSTDSGSKLGR